jgi:Flp pilus assembly protein TadD
MSPRARVQAVVARAAAAAVAGTVGLTLLQTRGESSGPKALKGAPPLWLDFGVRDDPEARALARAQQLYTRGKRSAAGVIFARYRSLEAELGTAFAAWPRGSLDAVKRLVTAHPSSSLAELQLGWALYWSGRDADAVTAWQQAARLEPDSPAAVDAEDALHSSMFPGLPYIVLPFAAPKPIVRLPAARQLGALARAARRPDARAKLLYGTALWRLKHPLAAERQFEAAARLAPDDPTALTLAAVGAFTKSDPVRAFARLGPLTARFPRAAVVRFHLALLLIWTRRPARARTQLRLTAAAEPGSVYAQAAGRLLVTLSRDGTK